jgi:hypothetical protein
MECANEAANAGLTGNFIALLAVSDAGVIERIRSSRGWVRMDGMPVADSPDDLIAGLHWYPVSLTLAGQPTGRVLVMTGSRLDGGPQPGGTCADWTSTNTQAFGGFSSWEGSSWLAASSDYCSLIGALYCLETDVNGPLPPPAMPAGARRAFVTEATVPANTTDLAADALCAQEGGSPRFIAMRAPTSGGSPISRFTLDGGWFRADGVPVVPDPQDAGGEFVAPLITHADAGFLLLGPLSTDTGAWLGALRLTLPSMAGYNCSSWASTAMLSVGLAWFPGTNLPPMLNDGQFCSSSLPLFCFEN